MEALLPVLVHIQANLDVDLSLRALARRVGRSPFQFHRLFRSVIGETLKQYTKRLRLERAANRLIVEDRGILDIALSSGFQSHETFSREFKRRFHVSPRDYRRSIRGQIERRTLAAHALDQVYDGFELSDTRMTRMAQLDLAFIRHVGPYEAVPDTLWHRLAEWAKAKGLRHDLVFLGIAHDSPGVTSADHLRFDAAIVVAEPFSARGSIGHQVLDAANYAVTTHVGHYRSLSQAYASIVQRIAQLKGYRIGAPPTVEVYRTTRVDATNEMNHTDIYIPANPIGSGRV